MTATVLNLPWVPHPHPMDLDWKSQVSAENFAYHVATRMGCAPERSRPKLVTQNGERVK